MSHSEDNRIAVEALRACDKKVYVGTYEVGNLDVPTSPFEPNIYRVVPDILNNLNYDLEIL